MAKIKSAPLQQQAGD